MILTAAAMIPNIRGPMVAGPPDLVDCEELAAGRVRVERVYELGELARIQDVLAAPVGQLRAVFEFARVDSGRGGARVAITATPRLLCQRCMEPFDSPLEGSSLVEFVADDVATDPDAEREFYRTDDGLVSLRDLAEEELLLALPFAPVCASPQQCGKAASADVGGDTVGGAAETVRPFGILQGLMKKHDRT